MGMSSTHAVVNIGVMSITTLSNVLTVTYMVSDILRFRIKKIAPDEPCCFGWQSLLAESVDYLRNIISL